MPITRSTGESHAAGRALARDLARHVALAWLLGIVAAGLASRCLASVAGAGASGGAGYFVAACVALSGGALLLLGLRAALPAAHPHPRFGAANRVTLLRGTLVLLVAGGLALEDSATLAWGAVALATLAASLDLLDGALARRQGLASRYGARFDMETDALLILVLALLAWRWQRADAWVLASGMMRYAFVLAARPWPWLGGDLAPSRRRQAICVVQVVALVAVLAPWWPAGVAPALAALALGLLCYSFGVDVLELARRRRSTEGVTA